MPALNNVLNLRGQRFNLQLSLQNQIELEIDRFISKFLLSKQPNLTLKIIVGKGLNSKRTIDNKNPLRFYTENYLEIMGLTFRSAPEFDGGEGVILVQMVG